MKAVFRSAMIPGALALVLLAVSLRTRPLIPLDETRLASVAWEMWNRGDWIVPHLNGVPYSHKPPLLYWIVGAGWWVFGVGAAWVRCVPALFALGSLVLTPALARRLWPHDPHTEALAPWVLVGTGLWSAFGIQLATYDAPLAFFVLAAALGILRASEGNAGSGFAWAGIAMGFGILAKGPVVLVHVLPLAFLAPLWAGAPVRHRLRAWYGGCLTAILLSFALGLAWVLPAARLGGAAYTGQILWSQTVHRLVGSFAHRRSFWFYLAFLPVVLAPWSFWPETWRRIGRMVRRPDRGTRFCLAFSVPVPILLSFVSGKQAYYLLPVLPAFALLLGRALASSEGPASRIARIPVALAVAVTGAVVLLASSGVVPGHPAWSKQIPVWGGIVLLLGATGLLAAPLGSIGREARMLAGVTGLFLLLLHAGALRPVVAALDLRAAAELLGRAEREGRPIAHAGAYEGQYHFLGRLLRPFEVIEPADAREWARSHPHGEIVLYGRGYDRPPPGWAPDHVQPSRGLVVEIWSSETLLGRGVPSSLAAAHSPR